MKLVALLLLALVVAGCHANPATTWTPADTAATKADLNSQRDLVEFCSSDAGCTGAQIKLVEDGSECNLGSMLQRHGVDQGDAGAGCRK